MKRNRYPAKQLPKTMMYNGTSIMAEGDHMKDEQSFIEATAPTIFDGDVEKASAAYKFILNELNPPAPPVADSKPAVETKTVVGKRGANLKMPDNGNDVIDTNK